MANAKAPAKDAQVALDVKIPIYLHTLPEEGGSVQVNQNVPVTVNGVTTIVPRGVRCEVPLSVFMALYDSGRFENL